MFKVEIKRRRVSYSIDENARFGENNKRRQPLLFQSSAIFGIFGDVEKSLQNSSLQIYKINFDQGSTVSSISVIQPLDFLPFQKVSKFFPA